MQLDTDAVYRQGVEALQQHRYKEAQAAFTAVMKADPQHANALYRMGETREQQGDKATAAFFYAKTIEVNPDHSFARGKLQELSGAAVPVNRWAPFQNAHEYYLARRSGDPAAFVPEEKRFWAIVGLCFLGLVLIAGIWVTVALIVNWVGSTA